MKKNWRNLEDFYSDLVVHYKWARPLSSIHWADLLGLIIIMAVGCGILRSGNKTWCIAHTDCMLSRLNIDWADSSTKLYTNLRYLWDLVCMMASHFLVCNNTNEGSKKSSKKSWSSKLMYNSGPKSWFINVQNMSKKCLGY